MMHSFQFCENGNVNYFQVTPYEPEVVNASYDVSMDHHMHEMYVIVSVTGHDIQQLIKFN